CRGGLRWGGRRGRLNGEKCHRPSPVLTRPGLSVMIPDTPQVTRSGTEARSVTVHAWHASPACLTRPTRPAGRQSHRTPGAAFGPGAVITEWGGSSRTRLAREIPGLNDRMGAGVLTSSDWISARSVAS